jgi:hypothetical protein
MKIRHYTFFQADGTCFSISAGDAWEAKAKELQYLGVPHNASYARYSEAVSTPAAMNAALRKAHRLYGARS